MAQDSDRRSKPTTHANQTPTVVVVIGGATGERGGVEVFLGRMIASCPVGRYDLVVLPANSAVLKTRSIWGGVEKLIAAVFHAGRRIMSLRKYDPILILNYGNAFDLVYLVIGRFLYLRKIIVIAHCSESWRHLRNRAFAPFVRFCISNSTVFALSREQISVFRKIGVTDVRRVPTLLGDFCSDLVVAPLWSEREPRSVAFCGRVSKEKGLLDALDCVAALSAGGGGWKFTICGQIDDGFLEDFQAKVSAVRSGGSVVEVIGRIDEVAVRDLMLTKRYQLYLSQQDAYPLAILEAISCGTIPVAYDLPGTLEIMHMYGGLAVTSGNWLDAAEKMRKVEASGSRMKLETDEVKLNFGGARFWREVENAACIRN